MTIALFAGLVIAVLAIGLGIGMLVAGRITAWMDRNDEDSDDR